MEEDLNSLRIDRSRRTGGGSGRAARWAAAGVVAAALAVAGWFAYQKLDAGPEVEVRRVGAAAASAGQPAAVVLNATGYIVAAHKIQLASKVMGKVAWIGVEKGNHVKQDQVLVRLEDDEYRAQLQQAKGQLASLDSRLAELVNGSRPEEVAQARANLNVAQADLENARVNLERTRRLVREQVAPAQSLDDAQARYDQAAARATSLQKTYDLVKIGPRQEQIDAMRGQVEQARGALAFAETNLANTVIRAPVDGTILERAVEKGEFVTTSFVGERGAKGYVVSLADLRDLEVELDISQNDFSRLHAGHLGVITTDAYPDRRYQGFIKEISPEANRQKATVQVKVKIRTPDEYLRPEMNASVAFLADAKTAAAGAPARGVIVVPATAVRDGAVFVLLGGRAVRRAVNGLIGGEDVIVNPPAGLKDGEKVRRKG
jgi:HlyD family secretion protein